VAVVEKHWNGAPAEICAAVLEAVRLFLGKELPHDDQTLLVVRLDQTPEAVNPTTTVSAAQAV
jgi:serine phosphatase RsbU (regulator of sigma subunit)